MKQWYALYVLLCSYDTEWFSKWLKMIKNNVSLHSCVKNKLGHLVTFIKALIGYSESYITNNRENGGNHHERSDTKIDNF